MKNIFKLKRFYVSITLLVTTTVFLFFYQNCGEFGAMLNGLETYHHEGDSFEMGSQAGLNFNNKASEVSGAKLKLLDRHGVYSQLLTIFGLKNMEFSDQKYDAAEKRKIQVILNKYVMMQKSNFGGSCTHQDKERSETNGLACDTRDSEVILTPVRRPAVTAAEGYIHLSVEEILKIPYAIDNFLSNVRAACVAKNANCNINKNILSFDEGRQAAYELFYPGREMSPEVSKSLRELATLCYDSPSYDEAVCIAYTLGTSSLWTIN